MLGILIKFNVYLEIKELDLIEVNEIIQATVSQYFEDRTFELYTLNRLFNPISYIDYKKNSEPKEIDAEKIKKATNKALDAFKNSYGKEV